MKSSLTPILFISLLAVGSGLAQKTKTPPPKPTNNPPVISKFESSASSIGKCGSGDSYHARCVSAPRKAVTLMVTASDPDGDELSYEYKTSAGEIFGNGPSVSWRLFEQDLGEYTATVIVRDSRGATATSTVKVKVMDCQSCIVAALPCPLLTIVSGEQSTLRGESLFLHVEAIGAYFRTRPDYQWTVTNGRVIRGQHSQLVEVLVTGDPGTDVSASVVVEGYEPSCSNSVSKSVPIKE